ncbi:hypothetical protein RDV78_05590 [Bacillota bacterium LX-D]|nr:hypothetical protein [Bacillota bacterium LX-D]
MEIRKIRKTLVLLLIAGSPHNKYLQQLAKEYNIVAEDLARFGSVQGNDCVLCGLCVKDCEELGTSAIATVNRGITKRVSTPYDEPAADCIGCGACAFVVLLMLLKYKILMSKELFGIKPLSWFLVQSAVSTLQLKSNWNIPLKNLHSLKKVKSLYVSAVREKN